jgi:hypothetical protein
MSGFEILRFSLLPDVFIHFVILSSVLSILSHCAPLRAKLSRYFVGEPAIVTLFPKTIFERSFEKLIYLCFGCIVRRISDPWPDERHRAANKICGLVRCLNWYYFGFAVLGFWAKAIGKSGASAAQRAGSSGTL